MTNTQIDTIKTRLDYIEKSIDKSDVLLDKRLHSMNEFRETLKDQNNTFMTRLEFEAKHLLLEAKIELLQKLVYIGVGIMFILEILLRYLIK